MKSFPASFRASFRAFFRQGLVCAVLTCCFLGGEQQALGEEGFVPLFDGKSLSGWRGDSRYWKVNDGVIVGNTKPDGISKNTFLIADGDYEDFVLRAKVKLINGASGIQFRSRQLNDDPDDQLRVTGYQADIDYGGSMGEFYEEKGRSVLQRADPEVLARHVKKNDWNAFEIRMIGDEGVIKVNGQVTSRFTEKDASIPRSGFVALQLQTGAMEIHFKDIEIRKIDPDAWKTETMLVSLAGNGDAVVRAINNDQILHRNVDAQQSVEWALENGRTTILQTGRYWINDRIEIPRSGVTLVVAPGATVELKEDTTHQSISFGSNRNPGYWEIVPLIYNRHNDVRVITLGTLVHSIWDKKASGKQTFPVIFDGRNEQKTCGIQNGTFLATGKSNQSFWLVDSRAVDIPMVTLDTGVDAAVVLEGCEDCSLGLIVNLAKEDGGQTGETVDLNSRNTGIIVERLVGERSYEIIDCNESHAVVHDAVFVGEPRKEFGGDEGSGPRFTSRPKLRSRSLDVRNKSILVEANQSSVGVDLPADIVAALPKFNIRSKVEVKSKDGTAKTYTRDYELDVR